MNCPNCNAKIKQNVFTTVFLVKDKTKSFINQFTENKSEGYCSECYLPLQDDARNNYATEKRKAEQTIRELIEKIPVITLHHPPGWNYEIHEMITAQSVSGTGIFAELASDWTDFFGKQSGSYNKKLKEGEDLCKNQLRYKALQLGANAIIGTDIDYSEAGAGKGMLMVCMAGTAVTVTNTEILKMTAQELSALFNSKNHLEMLSQIDTNPER